MNLLRNEGVGGPHFSQQQQQPHTISNGANTTTVLQHTAGHGSGGGGFNCRRCGKAEYRNGEFATIKLGDIFTHIDQFPSATSSETLCAACARVNDTGSRSQGGIHRHYNSNGVVNTNNNEALSSDMKPRINGTSTIISTMNYHGAPHPVHLTSIRSPSTPDAGVLVGNESSSRSPAIIHRTNDAYGSPEHVIVKTEVEMYRNEDITETTRHLTNILDNPDNSYFTVLDSNGALDTKFAIPVISQTYQNQNAELGHIEPKSRNGPGPIPYKILGGIGAPIVLRDSGSGSSSQDGTVKISDLESVKVKSGDKSKAGSLLPAGDKVEPPRVPCTLCKKTFKNQTMASIHLKRVHEKVNRFVCEICGVGFSYRGSLDSHLASHNPPEVTHDCPTCGQKFKEKSNLNKHIKYHTENPKKFLCEHCPSGFSKRVNLRYHIKRKHPEVAMNNNNIIPPPVMAPGYFPSPSGDKTGYVPSGAMVAASVVSSVTPLVTSNNGGPAGVGGGKANGKDKTQGNFKCEQCGRGFLFKNNLKAHLRTHTRDKKYTCDLCQKSFIYKESLKNHMLLHSNELPYLCDICGKKFRDRSNRRKHVKNVHKYMFVNGDINNPIPGSADGGLVGPDPASRIPSTGILLSTGEPKKKKGGKKGTAQGDGSVAAKPRNIIKSPSNSRGKKSKPVANSNPSVPSPNNTKSVIVSTSSSSLEGSLDRKIIMSPSPKNIRSPGSTMEYISHPHHSLPVTLHVPLAGPSGQFSHGSGGGRNIIVKASSTISSSQSMSPEMYLPEVGEDRGGIPMQQNVIVYPKPKGMAGQHEHHHLQYSSAAGSVIAQNLHQSQQQQHPQQYYTSRDQEEDPGGQANRCYESRNYMSHEQLHVRSSVGGQQQSQQSCSSQASSGFEYILTSSSPVRNSPSNNEDMKIFASSAPNEDIKMFGPSPQTEEISEIGSQFSNLYSADPSTVLAYHQQQQQHGPQHSHPQHYWTTSSNDPHPGNTATSPYSTGNGAEPPPGVRGVPSHFVSSHPITSASNVLNAPSYGQPHASESVDPSGNVSNFLYKDLSQFDFSYL